MLAVWDVAAALRERAKLKIAFNMLAAAHPEKTAKEVEAEAQRRTGSSLSFASRK